MTEEVLPVDVGAPPADDELLLAYLRIALAAEQSARAQCNNKLSQIGASVVR